MLDAGNRIAVARRAAGRDQDIGCAHPVAGRQLHGVGVNEHGPAFRHFDAGLVERRAVSRFQSGDFAILVGDQRRPIERGLRHGPAEAGGILEFAAKTRRIDQELLRHAAADDAGAAEPILLGDHNARAVLGGNARSAHAARTASDNEKIDVVISHVASSRYISWPRFFISSRMSPMTSADRLSPHVPALAMDFSNHLRLLDQHLSADRRLVEGEQLLQFRLGEMGRIDARGRIDELADPRSEFLLLDGGDLVEVLRPHEVGLHEHIFGSFRPRRAPAARIYSGRP